MAHTPGPWKTQKAYYVGAEDDEQAILAIDPTYGEVKLAEVYDRSDARLIAAAPDLLAACEALLRAHTKDARMDATLQIEFAVRKAKAA